MDNELKWDGCICESCDISLENMPTITGCTACCLNSWAYFREKAIVPFKKAGGLIFKCGPIFERLQ